MLFKLSLISRAKTLLCKKINCVDFFAFKNSAVLCSYCALSVFVKAPLTDGGWHPHTLEWFFTSSVDGSARHSIRRNSVVGREEVGEGEGRRAELRWVQRRDPTLRSTPLVCGVRLRSLQELLPAEGRCTASSRRIDDE